MKTQNILFFLKIISWIAFIGYAIVCGSVIFSFVLSFINPEIAKNMYKINPAIFELKEKNTVTFIFGFSLLIALAFMLAYLWFLVIKLFDKLKIGEGNNFLFMAAIVYIISQIFKRGIEMQEENELTV